MLNVLNYKKIPKKNPLKANQAIVHQRFYVEVNEIDLFIT